MYLGEFPVTDIPNTTGPGPEFSDVTLLEQAKGDDEVLAMQAFGSLYWRHLKSVIQGAQAGHAGCDFDDVIQTTFESALKTIRNFTVRLDQDKHPGRLGIDGWLYVIARRRARLHLNAPASKYEIAYYGTDPEALGRQIADPDRSVETQTVVDNHQELMSLFGALRPEQQELLQAIVIDGQTYAEYGERIGVDEATLRVRVFRACRQLREEFGMTGPTRTSKTIRQEAAAYLLRGEAEFSPSSPIAERLKS